MEEVCVATYEKVKDIVKNHQYNAFIWPDEFCKEGVWYSPLPSGENIEVEPILLDAFTANMLISFHDALNKKNQEDFKDWIGKTRAHFGRLVETGWELFSNS